MEFNKNENIKDTINPFPEKISKIRWKAMLNFFEKNDQEIKYF